MHFNRAISRHDSKLGSTWLWYALSTTSMAKYPRFTGATLRRAAGVTPISLPAGSVPAGLRPWDRTASGHSVASVDEVAVGEDGVWLTEGVVDELHYVTSSCSPACCVLKFAADLRFTTHECDALPR